MAKGDLFGKYAAQARHEIKSADIPETLSFFVAPTMWQGEKAFVVAKAKDLVYFESAVARWRPEAYGKADFFHARKLTNSEQEQLAAGVLNFAVMSTVDSERPPIVITASDPAYKVIFPTNGHTSGRLRVEHNGPIATLFVDDEPAVIDESPQVIDGVIDSLLSGKHRTAGVYEMSEVDELAGSIAEKYNI